MTPNPSSPLTEEVRLVHLRSATSDVERVSGHGCCLMGSTSTEEVDSLCLCARSRSQKIMRKPSGRERWVEEIETKKKESLRKIPHVELGTASTQVENSDMAASTARPNGAASATRHLPPRKRLEKGWKTTSTNKLEFQ